MCSVRVKLDGLIQCILRSGFQRNIIRDIAIVLVHRGIACCNNKLGAHPKHFVGHYPALSLISKASITAAFLLNLCSESHMSLHTPDDTLGNCILKLCWLRGGNPPSLQRFISTQDVMCFV